MVADERAGKPETEEMLVRFAEGRVVVTGAAGDIGSATAQALLSFGVSLVLVDRAGSPLTEVASKLARGVESNAAISTHELDISDERAVNSFVEGLSSSGPVSGLANVAGIYQGGPVSTVSAADWDRVLDVNLKGTFLMCKAFLPLLTHGGGGAIVNVSSSSGRTKSNTAAANYAASKAGVIGLTMLLAAQHGADNVRVNSVAPGRVDGSMFARIPVDQRQNPGDGVPLGRAATPAEIADAITFLLSEHATYITGETLNVNGGLFMV